MENLDYTKGNEALLRLAGDKAGDKKGKILLADDKPNMAGACKLALQDAFPNFSVDTAWSGQNAIDAIRDNMGGVPYSLLVSDINMTGLDGLQVAEIMREVNQKALIILTSGEDYADLPALLASPNLLKKYSPKNNIARLANLMLNGTVDRFLPKPAGIEDIINAVVSAVKEAEMRPELEQMREMPLNDVLLRLYKAKNPEKKGKAVILLVDDEVPMRSVLRRILKGECKDFEFIEAGDPIEALQKIEMSDKDGLIVKNRLAVVISDKQMPKMNGLEFIKRLREKDAIAGEDVLIGLLSGASSVNDREIIELLNKGYINLFLPKPFTTNQEVLDILKASAINLYKSIMLNRENRE